MASAEKTAKAQVIEMQESLQFCQEKIKLLEAHAVTKAGEEDDRCSEHLPATPSLSEGHSEVLTPQQNKSMARPEVPMVPPDQDVAPRPASLPTGSGKGGLAGAIASRRMKIELNATPARPQSVTGILDLRSPHSSHDGAGGDGEPEGVGVGMEITNSAPFVVKMLVEGGAAHKTGKIQPGDILREIDGMDICLLHIHQVKALLLGEAGSTVTLKLACAVGRRGGVYVIQVARESLSRLGTRNENEDAASRPSSKSRLRLM